MGDPTQNRLAPPTPPFLTAVRVEVAFIANEVLWMWWVLLSGLGVGLPAWILHKVLSRDEMGRVRWFLDTPQHPDDQKKRAGTLFAAFMLGWVLPGVFLFRVHTLAVESDGSLALVRSLPPGARVTHYMPEEVARVNIHWHRGIPGKGGRPAGFDVAIVGRHGGALWVSSGPIVRGNAAKLAEALRSHGIAVDWRAPPTRRFEVAPPP